MTEIKRRGETEKCPACGTRLDDDAYRCPKCRIYFCYKCRARVAEREPQYECANQACSCYGKLLCAACVTPVEEKGLVPDDDGTVGTLIAGGAAAAAGLFFGAPLLLAGAVGVGGIIVASKVAKKLGYNSWLSNRQHEAVIQSPLCCIQCKQPAKHLR